MFVVTLPASASKDPAAFSRKAKKAGADILEVRGDITLNISSFKSALPILLSPRQSGLQITSDYLDLEKNENQILTKGTKLIASFHDYQKTPMLAKLQAKALSLQQRKPWAIKIATFVQNEKDLVTLLALQTWLKKKKMRSIVLGMGPKAHLTRVLSPLRNALTYAVLDGAEPSAQGQQPLSFYALLEKRKKPKLFGILGGPHVTASLSPVIHNALFQRHKIDALYSCFPSTDFTKTIQALQEAHVVGYSVTAPFKQDAYLLARKKETLVKKLCVANTLKRSSKGFSAWLTDAYGIEQGYPVLKKSQMFAILGAGGAVPSAIVAIRKAQKNAKITVFARDPKKAALMIADETIAILSIKKAEGFVCDTVLCAVSADVVLPMPHANIAIDFRYGKETMFMMDARKRGMKVYDGVPMLIHQALKQFRHFTGKAPRSDDAEYLVSVLKTVLPANH